MIRLLIVDDEPEIIKIVRAVLEPLSVDPLVPFYIGQAGDAEEALKMHKAEPFDIFLIDIELPGMSGLQLLEKLRPRTSGKNVVIMSGRQEFDEVVKGMHLGASDYLTKPIRAADLVTSIVNIVGRIDSRKNERTFIKAVQGELSKRKDTISLLSDITEKERQRFAILLDAIEEAVLAVDSSGLLVMVNRRAGEIFGSTLSAMIGLPIKSCETCQQLVSILESDFSSTATEKRFEFNSRHFTIKSFPMYSGHGKDVVGHLFMVTDCTEAYADSLVRETMLSAMAHELRTPMTALRNFTFFLKSVPAQSRELILEQMEQSIEGIATQIDKLLRVAQYSDPTFIPQIVPIDINKLLNDVTKKAKLRSKNLPNIHINVLEIKVGLKGDYSLLSYALYCFLENSLKFSPSGGTITVDAIAIDNKLRLTVSDDGPGLPEALVPLLFRGPIQGEKAETRLHGGMGTGLYIVKKIADRLKGSVSYRPREGHGSVFILDVPC